MMNTRTDDNDNINDDAPGTAAEDVAMAEEEVKLQEAKLDAFRQRRDFLLTQQEKVRKKRDDLTTLFSQIQDRRRSLLKSRKRHLLLLEALQESLSKSKERLDKLTQLEALTEATAAAAAAPGDEPTIDEPDATGSVVDNEYQHEQSQQYAQSFSDDSTDDEQHFDVFDEPETAVEMNNGKESIVDANQQVRKKICIKISPNKEYDPTAAVNHALHKGFNSLENVYSLDEGSHDDDSLSSIDVDMTGFPVLADLNSLDMLQRYHNKGSSTSESKTLRLNNQQLLNFLPSMDASTALSYLNISKREADALDLACTDLSISPRRELITGTILDVLLLVRMEENGDPKEFQTTSSTLSVLAPSHLEMPIDPNLSLCPYELSGICADDTCPYQHTEKIPKILARERLPLPPLACFFHQDSKSLPSGHVEKNPFEGDVTKPTTEENKAASASCSSLLPTHHEKDFSFSATSDVGGNVDAPKVGNFENQDAGPIWSLSDQDDFLAFPPDDDDDNNHQLCPVENGDDGSDTSLRSTSAQSNTKDGISQGLSSKFKSGRTAPAESDSPLAQTFLWWGGRLPLQKEKAGQACSIADVLESTFGITLHDDPLDSTCYRIEIRGLPLPSLRGSDGKCSSLSFVLRTLGRLVDAIRLSTHSGRFDIAMTLNEKIKDELCRFSSGSLRFDSSLRSLMDLVEQQTNALLVHNYEPRYCFHTCMATALGCTMISACLFIVWKDCQKLDDNNASVNEDLISSLSSTCWDCWDILRFSQWTREGRTATLPKKDLNKMLSMAKSDATVEGVFASSKDLISWCQQAFSSLSTSSPAFSTQTIIERLMNTSRSINAFLRGDDLEERAVSASLKVLLAVIVVANSIIECASSVISEVCNNALIQDAGRRIISANHWADWITLDATILDVLRGIRKKLLEDDPLTDFVIAPLFGLSVTSACFIRKYSTAQNRLADLIGDKAGNIYHDDKIISLARYSELLWSQLIQLRMSLPELDSQLSIESGNSNSRITHANNTSTVSTLCNKIGRLGIRLHHVAPFGDWLLTHAADRESVVTEQQDCAILTLMRAVTGTSTSVSGSGFNNVLRLPIERCRTFASCSSLSPLPFLFLHIGQSLTSLDLSKCSLFCLPLTFGCCFPKMKYLNLSCNELSELPKSFEQVPRKMPHLEHLRLDNNRLLSLPDDIFLTNGHGVSWSLIFLDLSHNRLTSLPHLPPASLMSLEQLYLGNNELTDMTVIDFSRIALKLGNLRDLIFQPQTSVEREIQ